MLKPRNSIVIVKLIEQAERQHGSIVVPANKECYCEAEVMAIGPGNVSAAGGRSETFDLAVGQRVWVKHKEKRPGQGGIPMLNDCGIPYQDGGITYHGFEQGSILGIIAEPGEAPRVELKPTVATSRILHA